LIVRTASKWHAPLSRRSKIFLAGHRGLAGSAILRLLHARGYENVLVRSHRELDLTYRLEVDEFFFHEQPEIVILAAGKVGGILANKSHPAEFIYENLMIQTNVIDSAYRNRTKKFVFLGSSCIYPKHAKQPITEDALLSAPLEPTNDAYAVAKIAGLKMCQAYRRQYGFDAISLMPTNLYGPGDNFDLENSHVLPALIRRFYDATAAESDSVTIWGTGTPRREFLYVDDLADAVLFLLENYSDERPINVGAGTDIPIIELAKLIASEAGYGGAILTDPTKPDGTPQKLLDVSTLSALGWQPKVPLQEGIPRAYAWYAQNASRVARPRMRTLEST
jgi:GDP-L-fucose synthase